MRRVDVAIDVISARDMAAMAGKDLSNPAMTLENNPLAGETADDSRRDAIEARNMRRLYCDAKMRACPVNGHVYAGIMDTRYKGGD